MLHSTGNSGGTHTQTHFLSIYCWRGKKLVQLKVFYDKQIHFPALWRSVWTIWSVLWYIFLPSLGTHSWKLSLLQCDKKVKYQDKEETKSLYEISMVKGNISRESWQSHQWANQWIISDNRSPVSTCPAIELSGRHATVSMATGILILARA